MSEEKHFKSIKAHRIFQRSIEKKNTKQGRTRNQAFMYKQSDEMGGVKEIVVTRTERFVGRHTLLTLLKTGGCRTSPYGIRGKGNAHLTELQDDEAR